MKKALIIIAIVLVVIFALVAGLMKIQSSLTAGSSTKIKKNSIMVVDLSNEYPERGGYDFSGFKFKKKDNFLSLIKGIEAAADDEDIIALTLKTGGMKFRLAQIDELAGAIGEFKESGKPVYAYFENVGMGSYLIAAMADSIFMVPSGEVMFLGMAIAPMFYAGTSEKLGIGWDVIQLGDFKGAAEMFVNKGFSEPYRETLIRLMDGLYFGWVDNVVARRGFSEDSVLAMVDYGVFYGDEALAWGLVDSLMYPQDFDKMMDAKVGDDEDRMIGPATYANTRRVLDGKEQVAVIYGLGSIHSGKSEQNNPFGGTETIGSETMSSAIDDAVEDDDIKAIVIRVNSPGGSALASDIIWKSIVEAKKKKPVVVSMGGVAASGGYYISMAADSIFCDPNTITGSIGVIFLKAYSDGLFEWAGITVDTITRGPLADEFVLYKGMDDEGYAAFTRIIEKIYIDFSGKAAEGRGISPDSMSYLAQGRIWHGTDAVEVGLVDRLAGLSEVIDVAAKMAGIDEDEIGVSFYPAEKSFFEMAFEISAPKLENRLPEPLRKIISPVIEAATLYRPGEPLTLMPIRVEIAE